MSQPIVNYMTDTTTPAKPDASLPATVVNAAVVVGPGATVLGNYPKALDFGAAAALGPSS